MKKKRIPLKTELWAEVYKALIRHGVKFPKRFNGIGAAYAGFRAIEDVLEKRESKESKNTKI